MTVDRTPAYLAGLIGELRKLPKETEWVEFKRNNDDPERIGEYLSALANSAALLGKVNAYVLWGVDDADHSLLGTTFRPAHAKQGGEELETWLLQLLTPKIDFRFHELVFEEKPLVLLEIDAAFRHPVRFKGQEYIRVGSSTRKLKEYPEKERELWRVFDRTPFERQTAADNVHAVEILQLLDYPAYFDLLHLPLPDSRDGILAALQHEEMIVKNPSGTWDVTNLGAVLFAKQLDAFRGIKRKAVRVIVYEDDGKFRTKRERTGTMGYACGFKGLVSFLLDLLPSNEIIGQALRRDVPMFPGAAVRELVVNALIHQDFQQTGTGPMVEIFPNRMEITNPGAPLVRTERFLDSPPKSRNEALASFMRRIGICEERGSGVDKVVAQTEAYQLPAPVFEATDEHTRAILFAHRAFKDMDRQDRIRAAYLHACLRWVQRNYMTNASLRERFGFGEEHSSTVSRIIKDALTAGALRQLDDSGSRKYMKYVPSWA